MGVALDTETSLFLMVQESFSEEQLCEHSQHTIVLTDHAGAAAWYSVFLCLRCGNGGDILALCDKWKTTVESGHPLYCDECGYVSEGKEFYRKGWTRINGKGK